MNTKFRMTVLAIAAVLPLLAIASDASASLVARRATVAVRLTPARRVASSAFVGVPANYVYNPRLGSLHDYCTASPDQFPNPFGANADFRGPCARHDLCLGSATPAPTCNARLRADMRTNCKHTYGVFNPVRQSCLRTADIYWVAVTAKNPR